VNFTHWLFPAGTSLVAGTVATVADTVASRSVSNVIDASISQAPRSSWYRLQVVLVIVGSDGCGGGWVVVVVLVLVVVDVVVEVVVVVVDVCG
jgi:hypothetical protein